MDRILFFLGLIGTISFAISGAVTGVNKKMDIFGVAVLGVITATGGGIIRDLVLGELPPAAFREPVHALTAIAVSIIVFLPAVRKRLDDKRMQGTLLLITDSLGLAIFTVSAIQTAMVSGTGYNLFLLVFIGTVSGVGGGVLRDVLAGDVPYIFTKHVYACASIAGALVCALLWNIAGGVISIIAGSTVIFTMRVLSAKYHWSLPHA